MVDAQRGVPRIAVGRKARAVHALLAGTVSDNDVVPVFAGRSLDTVRLTGHDLPSERRLPDVDRVVCRGICAGEDGGGEPPAPGAPSGADHSGPGGRS